MDRLDGANAPSLTKKVQQHASIITPTIAATKDQNTKQVCTGFSFLVLYFLINAKIER